MTIPYLNSNFFFFHSNGLRRFITLGILILFNTTCFFGQGKNEENSNKIIKHQIAFRHDNDFLTFTDRYYSSGLFFSYTKWLEHGVFSSGHEQLSFLVQQEIYTPANTKTTNIVELDRPYVGFLGINIGWSYAKIKNGLETNFLIGIAGKASGAGDFHRWYHNALEVPSPLTWAYEIDNSFHFNLYGHYTHEWQLANGNFGVYMAVQPMLAVGTKDIYAQPELIGSFGKRNAISSSSAYNKIGDKNRELFFMLRTGYRFIAHNAMLEGNLLGDHSIFLVDPSNTIFYFGFDLKHRDGQNVYWFGYRFNSAESAETKSHKYIILSYARNF